MRIPVLHFGIVSSVDERVVREHLQSFCDALAFVLGNDVVGVHARNHGHLIDMMRQGKVDIAWLPPVVAMSAEHGKLTESLVGMVRRGATNYSSALISKASSKIRTVGDLRGVRAAWTHHESASGYLVPIAAIRASGIPVTRAFSEQHFVGHHVEVVKWVREGKVDVGATYVHSPSPAGPVISASWTEMGLPAEGEFQIISVSGPIPTDVISALRTFSSEHATVLRAALLQISSEPVFETFRGLFDCETFAPCEASHFASLRKLVRLLDLPSVSPFEA